MKMLISGLFVLVALVVFAFVPKSKAKSENSTRNEKGEGIQFIEADWNKALAEAKKQNKLIFLDAYASWCGACKLLKKNTFPDKEAGEYFNKNFVNVAMDMEKGDGPALSEMYAVNAYPTLIITDAEGKIITYTQGYIKPKQLIDFGKYGLSQVKK
ncbi:MAG: thioredoxin family protein [Bacteroidota bacterium]|nr:thioredoxin family protein [Bacteroidota bacterium]